MSAPKITPMLQQYFSIKEEYPEAILFYRMGDFYEMFFDDAQVASRILEITLTSRNKKDEKPIPMCGVPVKAAQTYIAKLIDAGKKVAVCEQVEDPAQAKGLVKREVTRLITPGMIIEDEFLDDGSNNYILSLGRSDQIFGIAWLDISTGTFRVCETKDPGKAAEEIKRVAPSEILLPESFRKDPLFPQMTAGMTGEAISFHDNALFRYQRAREILLEQFKTVSLEGFGCEGMEAAVGAAGALVSYIGETQKQRVDHVSGLETYYLHHYLMLDDLSCRNLELLENIRNRSRQGTLIGVVDRTVTSMGSRLLKRWIRYPLMNTGKIRGRIQAVGEAKDAIGLTREIREHLKKIYDLERLGSKINMGYANARDLSALRQSIEKVPVILELLKEFKSRLYRFGEDIAPVVDLAGKIKETIRDDPPATIMEGGMIREGVSAELDELISIARDGRKHLAMIESREKEATGITTLKVRYNKVFGYYIEVSKSFISSVPDHYIRKQTLVNAERYITEELKTFEEKVVNAQERRNTLEYEIFDGLRKEVIGNIQLIRKTADFLARLDCLLNFAELAERNDYCRPEFNKQGRIRIQDGRHPVVEKMITGERFVPNTIHLDNEENQILILTGPNMAGKSTILRQVALLVIMAQIGSFVPAASADFCITDRIFTRVGALDNLSQGQSTFMVEMQETANILNNAGVKSLVILDEIGRGTSTFDGLSIAWAVAEYLHELKGKGVKTLFATHYHELTELGRLLPRAKNFNVAVKEFNNEIIFLRKLVEGGTNRSYGIQVARLAGVPDKVIRRAKHVLAEVETRKKDEKRTGIASLSIADRGPVQLELFENQANAVLRELGKMDLTGMTPVDALVQLDEIQKKLKRIGAL